MGMISSADAAALASHELDRQRACERDSGDSTADEDRRGHREMLVTVRVTCMDAESDDDADDYGRDVSAWLEDYCCVETVQIVEREFDQGPEAE